MNGVAGAFPKGGAEAIEIGMQKAAIIRGASGAWTPREWCTRFRALSGRVGVTDAGAPCWHCDGAGYLGGSGGDALCDTCEGTGRTYPAKAPPCQRCRGAEWIALVPNAPFGHPAYGKAGPCPSCQGGTARRVLTQADVPPHYREGFTFETLFRRTLSPSQGWAADAVSLFAADPAKFAADYGQRAIVLSGPVGTLKTGMCVAAVSAFDAVEAAGGARYVNWLALLTRIQASYSGDAETKHSILASLAAAPLLVLDDFGVSSARKASNATVDVAEELVQARYGGGMWTLVTTNLTQAELKAEFGPRVASRLAEMALWCDIEGDDARQPAARAAALSAPEGDG